MAITEVRIKLMGPPFKDLLRRLDRPPGRSRELRDGVRRAVRIAAVDPEMGLARCRKVLELVVRDVYERRCREPPGTRPLENLLQRLVKDGHLPRREAAYANAVRELGNVGTHAFGERLTPADVYRSLAQLVPILEWYLGSGPPGLCARRRPARTAGRTRHGPRAPRCRN